MDPGTPAPDVLECEGAFWRNVSAAVLSSTIISGILLATCVWERRRQRLQERLATETSIKRDSHAFSVDMAEKLMPSFGTQRYQFRGMQAQKDTMDLEFKDLRLDLPDRRCVLCGVTGRCQRGRLFAVMGPSGAGKTTFMNVLSGRAFGKVGGEILVNGEPADMRALRRSTGFVPQDDVVHEDLTVREQIQYSVRLRGCSRASVRRVERVTEDVLNIMQLLHVQNSIVGSIESRGISGGERKRVNIGLELAAQPTVLYLDEPTSGLDATSSLGVASSLKTMCRLGMTSIMVIHQPRYSLFTLFDDVLLLGRGGRTVYLGPSLGVKPYFENLGYEMPANENAADWFMDVICGEVKSVRQPQMGPEALIDAWVTEGPGVQSNYWQNLLHNGRGSRALSNDEIKAIFEHALDEQWRKVDLGSCGVLGLSDITRLCSSCAGAVPSVHIVQDLMEQMAGKGAEQVSKAQFLAYMCSLSERVQDLDETESPGRSSRSRRILLGSLTLAARTVSPQRDGLPTNGLNGVDTMPDDDSADSDSSPDIQARCLPFEAILRRCRLCRAAQRPALAEEASEESSGSEEAARSTSGNRTGSSKEILHDVDPECRRAPGFFSQLRTLFSRRLIQWWRMGQHRMIFLAAITFGSGFLALMDRFIVPKDQWDAIPYVYLHTTLALLLSIFSLHVFGNGQPVFWRERSSGLGIFAFFLSRVIVNALDLLLQTMLFSSVYFLVEQVCLSYWHFAVPFLFTAYAASGWGYLVSAALPPKHGPFIVALLMFVTCGLLGEPMNLDGILEGGGVVGQMLSSLSVSRWTTSMSFCYSMSRLEPNATTMGFKDLLVMGKERIVYFDSDPFEEAGCWWGPALAALLLGTALHLVSYLCIVSSGRDK